MSKLSRYYGNIKYIERKRERREKKEKKSKKNWCKFIIAKAR
jgi:hypothetical protein